MKKLIGLALSLSFITVLFLVMGSAHADTTRDLWAGQYTRVGKVIVSDDGTTLTVEYKITEAGWCFAETHLYVGTTPPEKSAPGQFPYSNENPDCDYDLYSIPLSDFGISASSMGIACVSNRKKLYIAAHAVVCTDPVIIVPEPPKNAVAYYYYPNPNGDSYGEVTIIAEDGSSETYDGWCADPENKFKQGVYHDADVTPFDEFPGLEDLDLVNYIINHKDVYFGWGYDFWDIQATIWSLFGYHKWDGYAVPEIINDAIEGLAGGWAPGCGDVVAYVVKPTSAYDDNGNIAQMTIIEVPVECFEICETAWAFNKCDPYINKCSGKGNWARYFYHTVVVMGSGDDDDNNDGCGSFPGWWWRKWKKNWWWSKYWWKWMGR